MLVVHARRSVKQVKYPENYFNRAVIPPCDRV